MNSQSGGGWDGGGEEGVELITFPKEWEKRSEMVKYKKSVKERSSSCLLPYFRDSIAISVLHCHIFGPLPPWYVDFNDTWSTLSFSLGPLETAAFWITPPWFLRSAMAFACIYGPGEKENTRGYVRRNAMTWQEAEKQFIRRLAYFSRRQLWSCLASSILHLLHLGFPVFWV